MLEHMTAADGTVFFQSPTLRSIGVPHGFSTRIGPGGRNDFSLGSGSPENLPVFAHALGCASRALATVHQVHGTCVAEGICGDKSVEADAILSANPTQLILIRTADCVPILLSSHDGTRVAAIHAGWRGLVAGVIPQAAKALGVPEFIAAIGPCMGVNAFEVDEEVAQAFDAAGLGHAVERNGHAKPHVDLVFAAELQLRGCGATVVDSGFHLRDLCTYREEHWFFSHRRDRTHRGLPKTGHMGSAISCK